MSDIFITNDFINDCADASLTLKLFHARFNLPVAVTNQYQDVADYTPDWYTQTRSGRNPINVTDSQFLATFINKDRSSLIVKIPYIANSDQQYIGYLTYRRYRGNIAVDSGEAADIVAFVFNLNDFGVGRYRQQLSGNDNYQNQSGPQTNPESSPTNTEMIPSTDDNDNSYIYIDISKLNIVANLEAFYNQSSADSTESTRLWNYVNEHAHDLFSMTYTTVQGTNIPDVTIENKQGYYFDALNEKYSAQNSALHFSNKVTALTLPLSVNNNYISNLPNDDYRQGSLVQTSDGRLRNSNLMSQDPIDGQPVYPDEAEIDGVSSIKVSFNDGNYPDYIKKLYVKGYTIDVDDFYVFEDDGN